MGDRHAQRCDPLHQSVSGGLQPLPLCSAYTLPKMRGQDPYAAGQTVAKFQETLAGIDGSMFADPEHWWAVIVERNVDGLL